MAGWMGLEISIWLLVAIGLGFVLFARKVRGTFLLLFRAQPIVLPPRTRTQTHPL